nr:TPA_inf: conotoxin precursor SF-mi2 [Conus ebraeus]
MEFRRLVTVALLLALVLSIDAEPMQGMEAEGHFVRRDCGEGCGTCGGRCCCMPNSCVDSQCQGRVGPN